ncbi:hypothetical protein Tco_0665069 [Tanacetum coccineum]
MHNNIMASGSRDRPQILATGRYVQWQSRFLRYIDIRPNGDALRKCILEGPYTLSIFTILAVPATNESPEVTKQTTVETILNMSPENKAHYESEKEAIHLLLTGIGDEVYSIYQKEVNEIHAERIAKNANPLALVAAAYQYPDPYYQAPKPHRSLEPPSKQSSSTRSNATTKYKGKEISKPITPPSESAFEEDNDPEQAQRDKDINKNVDTSPRKPKRVKDYTYHKEKMLLCKQAEKGVPLQAKQANWLANTNEEIDEQELEAHYSYMAKIQERQHSEQPESISNTCVVEKVDSNVIPDSLDMCDNDIQTD